jgi:hypothetical protein
VRAQGTGISMDGIVSLSRELMMNGKHSIAINSVWMPPGHASPPEVNS